MALPLEKHWLNPALERSHASLETILTSFSFHSHSFDVGQYLTFLNQMTSNQELIPDYEYDIDDNNEEEKNAAGGAANANR